MNLPNDEQHPIFEASLPFDGDRIHAAAVYCSDGRFGEQCDDLLQNGLGLPRYDRLAIPGGAACLAGHLVARREEAAALEQLRFLIDAHGLERIVLIAHQDCAFYTQLLHTPASSLEAKQRADIDRAARRLESLNSRLHVSRYFARKTPHGTVQFEPFAV